MTRVAITYPVDALVSYHYFREDRSLAPLVATGRLRMIGDSGAFSALTQGAPIDLDAYAVWCQRWRQHLYWVASLDVIGDPVATLRNWKTLRERHNIDAVPTLHAGADTKWLDVYASEGVDFCGLGGMAGTGQAPKAYRWAVHMFRYARDKWPGMRFHLWGVTNRKFLDVLPAYSADSSGILGAAYRYAALRIFNPSTGMHHNVALTRGNRGVFKLGPVLRRVYGVSPEEIETSHPGNRTTLIQLAAASTQQYAAWLQRRHKVAPPTWGINPVGTPAPPDPGPRLHAAETSAKDLLDTTGTTDRVTGGGYPASCDRRGAVEPRTAHHDRGGNAVASR